MKILITGCCGLVGSECVRHFSNTCQIIGIDNNMREKLFKIKTSPYVFQHQNVKTLNIDISDVKTLETVFETQHFDAIIHCAAQPSHEFSLENPTIDFNINVQGTFNLLNLCKNYSPNAIFVFISTNKVYGDYPNKLNIVESENRYDFESLPEGIDESTPIDQSVHSIFGASKASADLFVQEFGHSFGMKTVCFRCGCITGELHKGVALHGFLSYLCKNVIQNKQYTIIGYKGKQVRDNIHSKDLVQAIEQYLKHPRYPQVYNLGGGKSNSCSILEALSKLKKHEFRTNYINNPRLGDHICYYSDNRKFQKDFPDWSIRIKLDDIFVKLCDEELSHVKK